MSSLYFLLCCAAAIAQTPVLPQDAPDASLRVLQVDAGKVTGAIRSFQGLNGPPSPIMEGLPDLAEGSKEKKKEYSIKSVSDASSTQ
jgi:hypothetical protein